MAPERIRLRIDKPVHGGHAIARHEGRVIFVRHGAPGELVTVELTEKKKIWRGDVVDVHEPHPARVPVRWEHAGPAGVGAELAHLSLPGQREWKEAVLHDALGRIGGLEVPIDVTAVDDGDGWHTRTRIELTANDSGRAGMFRHRTHEHVPLAEMPLAHPDLDSLDLFTTRWPAGSRITAVAPSADGPVALVDGVPPPGHPGTVWERVADHEYLVDAGGFWQVHTEAPSTLLSAVLQGVGETDGATILDLFSGAGLFTGPLAGAAGPGGQVISIEGNRRAHANARINTEGRDNVTALRGPVETVLDSDQAPRAADIVVLDPPRVGARREVMRAIAARRPRRIVYVSCDPAALARDLSLASEAGYVAQNITAYDLFPHTHHIEAVTILTPGA